MTTNRLSRSLAAFGLALGAVSYQAAAMEEVVVYGSEPQTMSAEDTLRIEMNDYVRSLNHALKAQVNADIARLTERKIQIAAAKIPTRG